MHELYQKCYVIMHNAICKVLSKVFICTRAILPIKTQFLAISFHLILINRSHFKWTSDIPKKWLIYYVLSVHIYHTF